MQERRVPSEQIRFVEGASLDRDQQWRFKRLFQQMVSAEVMTSEFQEPRKCICTCRENSQLRTP